MDAEQHVAVKERVQGSPVQSWYKIYQILFPDDDELPASPYAEWVTGDDLRKCFEMLMGRLPRLLFQAAISRQPQAGNVQQTRTTTFPTTAEVIQQALKHCQKEYGQATGLSHVFASAPPSQASSGSDQGRSAASRGRASPDEQRARASTGGSQQSRVVQAPDEDEDEDDSSDEEMDLDVQRPQTHRHGQPSANALRGRQGTTVPTTMSYGSVPYTPVTMPPTEDDLLHARYIQDELYPGYEWPQ